RSRPRQRWALSWGSAPRRARRRLPIVWPALPGPTSTSIAFVSSWHFPPGSIETDYIRDHIRDLLIAQLLLIAPGRHGQLRAAAAGGRAVLNKQVQIGGIYQRV